MIKVLVTGCGGQLARSLAERGISLRGVEVICVGRPDLDLLSSETLERTLDRVSPDVVINGAAFTAVDLAEDEAALALAVNRDGAGSLAAAAATRAIPFVQISTDYVFDGSSSEPYQPEDQPHPLGTYGRSKLAGEHAAQEANPKAIIVRTSWVYSPFGRNFLKTMMRLAEEYDEVSVVADQVGNPTSALDLAEGLLAMCECWRTQPGMGLGQTYHAAGGGETSWWGFAEHIFQERRALGLKSAVARPIPTSGYPTKAVRPLNSRLDSSKFARDFKPLGDWRVSSSAIVRRLAVEARP